MAATPKPAGTKPATLKPATPRLAIPKAATSKAGDLFTLGRVALERGALAEAVVHFKAASAEEPKNTKILVRLGRALRELGRGARAEAVYRRVLALEPTNVAARLAVGRAAGDRGEFREAADHLRAAEAEEPDNVKVLTALGRALLELDRPAEAQALYRRVLAIEPMNAAARKAVGQAAWKQGRRSDAVAHLQATAAGGAADPKLDLSLGEKLLAQLQVDEAAVAFRRVLAADADNVGALKGLARCALAGGDEEEALAMYRAAAARQPGDPRLKSAIRRLGGEEGAHDWKAEVRDALAVLRAADSERPDLLWAAQMLVAYGITRPVVKRLTPLEGAHQAVRRLLQLARQLEHMGLTQTSGDPGKGFDPETEQLNGVTGFTERLNPGAETLVLFFSGAAQRAFLSLDLMHRILRTTGASVVYMRDLERNRYLGGVVGLGEGFGGSAEAFRAIMAKSGARRLLMIGNCTGSAGALRYGLALGAEAVLAIAPRILDASALETLSPKGVARLREVRASLGPFAGDLATLYLGAKSRPRLTLIAGAGVEPEASFARNMAEKVPGVVRVEVPGVFNQCLGDILARGLLSPLLSSFVATGDAAPYILESLGRPAPRLGGSGVHSETSGKDLAPSLAG